DADSKKDFEVIGSGNLYEVDIPDEQIDQMLDWDKPLDENSMLGRDLLDAIEVDERLDLEDFEDAMGVSDAYKDQPEDGQSIYGLLSSSLGGDKEASEFLNSLGIPGIKYLDGTSRSAGEGTRNFVVFEPDKLKILKRNEEKVK
ncbi:MAG: hypothetical protein DRI98_13295, partial [Bacteroidetes bacterium]